MLDLQLNGLVKSYGTKEQEKETGFSIQRASLNIQSGELFALLGPSGCGKTTLLKLVAGLIPADDGHVMADGVDISTVPAEKRGFGMVFQQPLLFPHLSVIDNVAFGLKMQGMCKKERRTRAKEMLAAVELEGYDHRLPRELSGGQQQRVSLARAIVTRPKLLLLDEPFSALDPGIRAEMRQLLKAMHERFHMTILLVTHDRNEAFELADRLAVMNEGEIMQVGRPMEVYRRPENPFVARFIGSGNVLKGVLMENRFIAGDFTVQLDGHKLSNEQSDGWLVIQPELFRLTTTSGADQLNGKVREVRFRQGVFELQVEVGGIVIEVIEKALQDVEISIGDTVALELDASQAHFIVEKDVK